MNEYILFMHAAPDAADQTQSGWPEYFAALRAAGAFEGGSAIGGGVSMSKSTASAEITRQIVGYIRIQAKNLDAARALVAGNPVYEAGGTVEIRELPKTG